MGTLHKDICEKSIHVTRSCQEIFSSLKVLVHCIPHCLIAIVIISTILADRDDVAVGDRHDNQTGGKRGGMVSLLALVWDDSLLGNARNRRVSILDPRIFADDDRTCLWTRAHREKSASELANGH